MRTLTQDRFAPITSSVGFLQARLPEVQEHLLKWRRSLYSQVTVSGMNVPFPDSLMALEPLVGGARPRELLVELHGGEWTAYFDSSLRGTDATSAIGVLAEDLGCQGLAVTTIAHTTGLPTVKSGRSGAVQFTLFGPLRTDFLNYVRSVSVTYTGSKWEFHASGLEQIFEETATYLTRRVRDRFTTAMLERYCQALGVGVFDESAYTSRSVLIESDVPLPANARIMSLQDAQLAFEIRPELLDDLPG